MEPYGRALKEPARSLRIGMTDAEQALWQRVRRKQIGGTQFYRQKPLLSYIVDFYCPAAKLVVELDGSQHLEEEHQVKDRLRDEALAQIGLQVLRFDNRQVLLEIEAVLAVIDDVVRERLKSPSIPLLQRGKISKTASANTIPPFEKGGQGGICGSADLIAREKHGSP